MAKYCDSCRQSYADELESCPRCHGPTPGSDPHLAAVNGVLKDAHAQPETRPAEEVPCVSDPEIDLGSPVTSAPAPAGGPPSGASFVSWAELLQGKGKGLAPPGDAPIRFDPPSGPAMPPAAKAAETAPAAAPDNDAEIDLSEPMRSPNADDGPPSGASFVSWTSLLREQQVQKKQEDTPVEFSGGPPPPVRRPVFPEPANGPAPETGAVRTARGLMDIPADVGREAPPRSSQRAAWLGGLLIGIVLAVVICLALWAAGFEPPPSWRLPARLPSDGAVPPVTSPESDLTPR